MNATVITIQNPFDVRQQHREEVRTDALRKTGIARMARWRHLADGVDVVVGINGVVIQKAEWEDIEIQDGDAVTLAPKVAGDDANRAIAMIAVYATATMIGGMFGNRLASSLIAGAITVGGGMLINEAFPSANLSGDSFSEPGSATYGWTTPQNRVVEGGALPIIYGTHKVYPPLISRYTDVFVPTPGTLDYTYDTWAELQAAHPSFASEFGKIALITNDPDPTRNQYWECISFADGNGFVWVPMFQEYQQSLYLLFAVCEGLINSIDEIEINGALAWSGGASTGAFDGLSVQSRLGSNNQTRIDGFDDIVAETPASIPTLDESYTGGAYAITSGEDLNELRIGLLFPRGLYYRTSTGEIRQLTVNLNVQYRKVGTSTWIDIAGTRFSDYRESPVRRLLTVTGLSAGQYEVQARFAEEPVNVESLDYEAGYVYSDGSYGFGCQLEFIGERKNESFTYPHTALLAVQAIATANLSGSIPRVSCTASRTSVLVWNDSAGAWQAKAANNPAWACYDMLVGTVEATPGNYVQLYGGGVSKERMVYQDFADWADFCDDQDLTCNVYIDQTQNLSDALDLIASLGRGRVIQRAQGFGAVWDEPKDTRAQLFTMGNIIKDSFSVEYIAREDRANVVQVTYFDASNDYERTTIEVSDTSRESGSRQDVVAEVTLVGCTSRSQALRHAQMALNKNRWIIRAASWKADAEALTCEVGDRVGVQHELPRWGDGGRVLSATNNTVTLRTPVSVDDAGASYIMLVRKQADGSVETRAMQNPGVGEHAVWTLASGTWASNPQRHDLFSIGTDAAQIKDFKVTEIRRDADMIAEIRSVEYVAAVYDDTVAAPEDDTETGLAQVTGLQLREHWAVGSDGIARGAIEVTWRGAAFQWWIYARDVTGNASWGNPIAVRTSSDQPYRIDGLTPGRTYQVAVTATGVPDEGEKAYILLSLDAPGAVTGLNATVSDNNVLLRWNEPFSELKIEQYEVLRGNTLASAERVGTSKKTFDVIFEPSSGTFTYWVRAVNLAGLVGAADSVTVDLELPTDYEQLDSFDSTFDGSLSAMRSALPGIAGPIDTTTTWDDWFDDNGMSTFQDFINGGYEYYFQPDGETTGSYTEPSIDTGATIREAQVRLSVQTQTVGGGSVVITPTLRVSENGSDWTTIGGWQGVGTSFRYIDWSLDIETSDGETKVWIQSATVSIVLKKKIRDGQDSYTSPQTYKDVDITDLFTDVSSIMAHPLASTAKYATVDFTDAPNPTSFRVRLFDADGNATDGSFYWIVRGV